MGDVYQVVRVEGTFMCSWFLPASWVWSSVPLISISSS